MVQRSSIGALLFAACLSPTLTWETKPVPVVGLAGVASLAAGTVHTCAVLEDTVPANEIHILLGQVALRSPLLCVLTQRHFRLKGHRSPFLRGRPSTSSTRSNLIGHTINRPSGPVNVWKACGKGYLSIYYSRRKD